MPETRLSQAGRGLQGALSVNPATARNSLARIRYLQHSQSNVGIHPRGTVIRVDAIRRITISNAVRIRANREKV